MLRRCETQRDLNQALKRSLIRDLGQKQLAYLDMTDYMLDSVARASRPRITRKMRVPL